MGVGLIERGAEGVERLAEALDEAHRDWEQSRLVAAERLEKTIDEGRDIRHAMRILGRDDPLSAALESARARGEHDAKARDILPRKP